MHTDRSNPLPAKGIQFLIAAAAALPRSLGDRERSKVMNDLMAIAIDARMAFGPQDAIALRMARLGISTSVGVFDPFCSGWYDRACASGGTYARMWENDRKVKPLMAAAVYTDDGMVHAHNRIAPRLAVVLAGEDPDVTLDRTHDGLAIWWCTSIDLQRGDLVLCRYRGRQLRGRQPCRGAVANAPNTPARRMKLSRAAWEQLQPRLVDLDAVSAPQAAAV